MHIGDGSAVLFDFLSENLVVYFFYFIFASSFGEMDDNIEESD